MLKRLLRRLARASAHAVPQQRTLGPTSEFVSQKTAEPLSEAHLQIVDSFRQGDFVQIDGLQVVGSAGAWILPTPDGAVLLTQTCDAIRSEKLTVALAPVVRVEGGTASNARDGKVLRYIHLPLVGFDAFVDMSVVTTIDKAFFATLQRTPGIDQTDDDAVREFGRAVGRRFGRFPFPDEVTPWLRPLEVVVQSKHDKQSPEGAAMRDVVELRVEAVDGWQNPPYALTLCVIVKPGVVPSFPNDVPPCPDELLSWLRTGEGLLRRKSSAIAARLETERKQSPSSASVYWLWLALAEAWAALCSPDLNKYPTDRAAEIQAAVTGISADLLEEREFNLFRYRRSEQLDVDHLSHPTPL